MTNRLAPCAPTRLFIVPILLLTLSLGIPGCTLGTSGSISAEAAKLDPSVEMIQLEGEAARYWPRWRGPSGQGLVSGVDYPDRWSAAQNVLWKVPVPGRGHSSPIIWGEHIFVTTATEEGQQASILAYRRQDGKLLWQTAAPTANPERIYHKNSHASATASTDGQRVYAYFGNHGLIAVDFEGNQVWHRPLGPMNNYHGTAGSPLLYKDRLILFQDQGGRSADGSFIAAYDTANGKELWRTERREGIGWGTPVAIRVDDHDEIVVSSQARVYGYDPATGKELWFASGNKFEVIPTPVVGAGLIFCSSGRAGPTLAIRPGGRGDVTDTHIVWQSSKGSPFVPSPLLKDGILYMINDMVSVATAYGATTGELLWQGRLGEPQREGFSASPVSIGEKLFFTNDLGQTFVLKTGRVFELLHTNELGEPTLASPALVDGKWYFRTADHLIAIGG